MEETSQEKRDQYFWVENIWVNHLIVMEDCWMEHHHIKRSYLHLGKRARQSLPLRYSLPEAKITVPDLWRSIGRWWHPLFVFAIVGRRRKRRGQLEWIGSTKCCGRRAVLGQGEWLVLTWQSVGIKHKKQALSEYLLRAFPVAQVNGWSWHVYVGLILILNTVYQNGNQVGTIVRYQGIDSCISYPLP